MCGFKLLGTAIKPLRYYDTIFFLAATIQKDRSRSIFSMIFGLHPPPAKRVLYVYLICYICKGRL